MRILPGKTRIAFAVRMSFAEVRPRRTRLDGPLVPARRAEGGPFRNVETISRRNHVHHVRIGTPADLNAEFELDLREA